MAEFNFPSTSGAQGDGSFTYSPSGGPTYRWYNPPGVWRMDDSGGGGGGGGATIEIGDQPPTTPDQGDLWWNTDDGKLYVYYAQANGQSQLVEAAPSQGFDGGQVNNSITQPTRTIESSSFDLSTGPFWLCGAIDIPNPSNAVTGMTGTIRLSDAPTSWASNFKHANGAWVEPSTFPAIVPFYVHASDVIEVGLATEGIA